MKKLLIIGHARHGKDTFAEFLRDLYGYTFESSSLAASNIFIYDKLKYIYNYKTPEECFNDRVNHRAEWYNLIVDFNRNDRSALAKEILKKSDIYVGMRDNDEIEECIKQGLFDLIIGVYNYRVPEEDKSSFNINLWEKSDIIIPNSQGVEDLKRRAYKIDDLFFNSNDY